MAADAMVIDLTALSSDDDEKSDKKNVSLVRRASASWDGINSPAKRRRVSPKVTISGSKPARCCRDHRPTAVRELYLIISAKSSPAQ
jgi:hypothetical protein